MTKTTYVLHWMLALHHTEFLEKHGVATVGIAKLYDTAEGQASPII